ncbi:30S ribosomal protein S5 [Candidatus Falkowbacteria bacterium]|nr:30S ribosomal protein S5 [Candidatus Falkowbacteria bacterium]
MTEEKKQLNKEGKTENKNIPQKNDPTKKDRKRNFRRDKRFSEKRDEFDQRILDIARVTRVMAGGKRMRFRACVAVGDKKGKIGVGVGKGADVTIAVNKAVNRAKKDLVDVPLIKDTIPHEIFNKFSAAKIVFKPAKSGRGVIAGGVVRVILELAGIKNITSKILGTNNKLSNAKCTLDALRKLKKVEVRKADKKDIKPAKAKEASKNEEKKEDKTNKDKKKGS